MGRIHKPWTMSELVQLFLEQPGRMFTKSQLYKRINADRYPDEWFNLQKQIALDAISDAPRFQMRVNPETEAQEITLIDRGY